MYHLYNGALCWVTSEVLEFSDSWTLFRLKGVSLEKHSAGREGRWAGRAEEHAGVEHRQMSQKSRRVYTQGSRPGGGHSPRSAIKNIGLGPSLCLLNQSLWGPSILNMPPAWFQCAQTRREAVAVPAPPWEFHGPGFESSVAFWESQPHLRGEPRLCVDVLALGGLLQWQLSLLLK